MKVVKKTGALLFFHSSYEAYERLVRGGRSKDDEDRAEKILLSKFNVIFEFGTDCRNLHFVSCVAMDLSKHTLKRRRSDHF